MQTEDFQVYREWPENEIAAALAEFKEQMYDGANVAQLQAGLRCLDFLCTGSTMSAQLQEDVEGTMLQANMRIELLLAQPHPENTQSREEGFALVKRGVEGLQRIVEGYRNRFLTGRTGYAVEDVYEAVQARVRRRLLART